MKRGGIVLVLAVCAAIWLGISFPRPVSAEHFDILLKVVSGEKQAEATMDTTPPVGGVNPRPIVHIKTGDEIKINWQMKNGFPHGSQKNVGIHFFVVREAALGQKPVPDPAGQSGIAENSFVMDFAPDAACSGALRLKISDKGAYLVRVQSENTHDEHGHEHFAGIDLDVE